MTHRRNRAALAALLFGPALACSSSSAPPPRIAAAPPPPAAAEVRPPPPPAAPAHDYPETRRQDVVAKLHGVDVHDPYRWLEDPTAPEVADWMKAQDTYARSHLAKLPGRDALAARLTEVFYFDALGPPQHRGDRYFFSHKHKDQEKAVIYWKQGERGADKVLLDPNTWSTDGSAGLRGWWPSWDGRYVAYNRNEHNADEATMHIVDVTSGKPLAEAIPGTKYGGASWTPDGRGFYYVRLPPSDTVS